MEYPVDRALPENYKNCYSFALKAADLERFFPNVRNKIHRFFYRYL